MDLEVLVFSGIEMGAEGSPAGGRGRRMMGLPGRVPVSASSSSSARAVCDLPKWGGLLALGGCDCCCCASRPVSPEPSSCETAPVMAYNLRCI